MKHTDPLHTTESPPTTHFGYQRVRFEEKTERVKQVFSSVSKRYDIMNDLMSFGLHRFWKRLCIARCGNLENKFVLDLAAGTGDLSLLLARRVGKQGKVVAADINPAMLSEARARSLNQGIIGEIAFSEANAESLPFKDQSFACVVCAFGLRNVTDKNKALNEMVRVLEPGGRMVVLEFSHMRSSFLKKVYDRYSFSVLPLLGKLICRDSESYQYLAESIRMHENQDTLKQMMEAAGLTQVNYQNVHEGIIALHSGFKC